MTRTLAWIPGSGGFGAAVDWIDQTSGAAPAQSAPGDGDIASIAGPTGAQFEVITGPGEAASLNFTGNTALSGSFITGSVSVGDAVASGTLLLDPATQLNTSSALLANGSIQMNAATLSVSGSLVVDGGLTLLNQAVVQAGSLMLSGAVLTLDAGSAIEVGTAGTAAGGTLSVDAGATLTSRGGLIEAALVECGVLAAVAGLTGLLGNLSGNGLLQIGAGAELYLDSTVGASGTVAFTAATGTLMLGAASNGFAGEITGFVQGDVIDVSAITVTGASYTATGPATGTLTLSSDGVSVMSLALAGNYATAVFITEPDTIDGTVIMLASGTLGPFGTLSAGNVGHGQGYIWMAPGGGNWGTATNWKDQSTGANPALIAPGTPDVVKMVGPAVGVQIVTGPGQSATLEMTGNTALSGAFTTGALVVGSTLASGGLFIEPASSLVTYLSSIVSGSVEVSGAGAWMTDSVNLILDAGTKLSIMNHGSVEANVLTLNGGTLAWDSTGTLEVGISNHAAMGLLSVDATKTLVVNGGLIAGPVLDNGTMLASGNFDIVAGAITGTGTLRIGAGATLIAASTVAATDTIAFAAATGVLQLLDGAAGGIGKVSGFAAGDAIDIANTTLTGAVYTPGTANTGTLTLSAGGKTAMSINLLGAYADSVITLAADGAGGTLVMLASGGNAGPGDSLSAGTVTSDQYTWLGETGGDWDNAGNWADTTTGATPAAVAPGTADTVAIAGPTGAAIQIISGQGSAASLSLTGNTALDGNFSTGVLSIASGTLEVEAGATLAAATASPVAGAVLVSGAGAELSVGGTLVVNAAMVVANLAAAQAAGLVLDGGSVSVDATATLEIGTLDTGAAGVLSVDSGATLVSVGGWIAAGLVVNGALEAAGGVTAVLGNIEGSGVSRIDAGSTLFATGTLGADGTLIFAGGDSTLLLAGAGAVAGTIEGFVPGDVIDLSDIALNGSSYGTTPANAGTLELATNGGAAMLFAFAGNYAGTAFQTVPDGAGGTLITLAAGAAGTLSAGTTAGDTYSWLGQTGGDWGTAVNWADTTTGAGPALIAPGSNDVVSIAGAAGSAWQIVSGQGQSASLAMTANIMLAGQFATGALTLGGVAAAGTLDIAAGTTLTAATATLVQGGVQMDGAGALLSVGGSLTVGCAMTLLNQAGVQAEGMVLDGGTVSVDGTSSIEIGNDGTQAAGALSVDAGAILSCAGGTLDAALVDNGVLEATGGVTTLLDDVSGSGALLIDAGATLAVCGTVGFANSLLFSGGSGTLVLPASAQPFAAGITGFAPGEAIDAAGTTLSGVAYAQTGPGVGTLTLSVGGQAVWSLTLDGNYATARFLTAPDGAGGTEVTQAVPCYAAGTRILTPSGEVAVEQLRVGDAVVTLPCRGARVKRIVWIGRRAIDVARHRRKQSVCPVRVRRGAFGPGKPHRDLLLSPEHAVYIDGVLMPVHRLLNGATIARAVDVEAVTYLHVELECHDVMFAEGLPAESYLDTGNRDGFADSPPARVDARARAAYALDIWAERAAAPLVLDGPRQGAAKRFLAARAAALGWRMTGDAALRVLADGVEIWPVIEGWRHVFALPAGLRELRLVSRRAAPAEIDPENPDHRCLGVAVQRIALDGCELHLADSVLRDGWYQTENAAPGDGQAAAPTWRWTDGNAGLDGGFARRLEVTLLPILQYWTEDMPPLIERADWSRQPCDRWCGAALAHAAKIVLEGCHREN